MSTTQTPATPTSSAQDALRAKDPRGVKDQGDSPLVSEDGSTSIADDVVAKIAEMAAREVRGVHELSSGLSGALRRFTPGMSGRGSAADVEVGKEEAIVDLDVVVDYGVSIPTVAQSIRENVMTRLEHMTGLRVKEVNIEVSDLYFVEDERRKEAERARDRDQGQRVQ
jgi:uncharacterized alkaline shock family protein YloU